MGDVMAAHLRLTILRLLAGAPGYRANSSIVHSAAAEFGFVTSRDRIKTEIAWLAEQGCVTATDVMGLTVATLTARGHEVAEGMATQPGVQRPAPGA